MKKISVIDNKIVRKGFIELDFIKNFYFCFDKIKASKMERWEHKDGDTTWVVKADKELGYPSVVEFKVFMALLKIMSRLIATGQDIPQLISFSINGLAREMGFNYISGKVSKDIKNAIRKMTITKVICKNKRIRKVNGKEHIIPNEFWFSIFSNCAFKGEVYNDRIVEESYVILDPVFRSNLSNSYWMIIDFNTFDELKTEISKLLYLKLKYHFHILDMNNKKEEPFKKKYNDICEYWLLIKPRDAFSKIKEQLKRHLDELVTKTIITRYDITKAMDGAFMLVFHRDLEIDNYNENKQIDIEKYNKYLDRKLCTLKEESPEIYAEVEIKAINSVKSVSIFKEDSILFNEAVKQYIADHMEWKQYNDFT